MGTTWDRDTGEPINGTTIVRDRILRIADTAPENVTNGKIVLDGTTEQSLKISGKIVYLQNVGANILYMDNKTGVNADKWELNVRGKAGPITATDRMYFNSAGPTTLKYIFVG